MWVGTFHNTLGSDSATFDFYPFGGTHLCLYIYATSPTLIADTTYVPSPPPPPPVEPAQHTDRIPSSIGHQADQYHYHYAYLNSTVGPSELHQARIQDVVTRSARRWGISIRGETNASPDDQDGQNTIGFSYSLADGILGQTAIYYRRIYAPGVLHCVTRKRHHRRVRICHRGPRRFIGTQVTEEDLKINANQPWNEGPFYPDTAHYDLETTLLHELGHFAGNPHHVYGCTDSPMIDAAAPGDWWHAPNDWARTGCSAAADRRTQAAHRRTARFVTLYIDVTSRMPSRPRHGLPSVKRR